ncbi:two-component regulator propeller domain-containing protein [Candidatus Halobeggiatoa sp. HSG11]|nr:two-component regulator propeller domain-containing protein [Candidatus Halobeggiatoa sp. HSG11]
MKYNFQNLIIVLTVCMAFIGWNKIVHAADLTIEPPTPVVESGGQIVLSVSGTSGKVTWTSTKGQIQGIGGNQVNYIAPTGASTDAVVVLDEAGNFGAIKITISPLIVQPTNAMVAVNKQITLSVSGTNGEVTWTPIRGQIQGIGHRVTYLAPAETGADVVTILDEAGNLRVVKITVLAEGMATQTQTADNATWEVFTSRRTITTTLLGKTNLWVGTTGGLEQREANTGQLIRIYTSIDGLPSNKIKSLHSDNNGGVWIGTTSDEYYTDSWSHFGLVHIKANGTLTTFNSTNSELPYNEVKSLISDQQGGIWAGSNNQGLIHLDVDGNATIFNAFNSQLPEDQVNFLLSDEKNGLWVGTKTSGLVHFDTDNNWTILNQDNSKIPSNYISSLFSDNNGGIWMGENYSSYEQYWNTVVHLDADNNWTSFEPNISGLPQDTINSILSDGQNGIWVGTRGDGLAHFDSKEQWTVLNQDNSQLPENYIISLAPDNNGGLWIATNSEGLAHRNVDGNWSVFNPANSKLPNKYIHSLISDQQGGVWIGTPSLSDRDNNIIEINNLIHLDNGGNWNIFNPNNSELPGNSVLALQVDGKGGVWAGTDIGLAHLDATGQWTIFNQDNSALPNNRVTSLLTDNQDGIWIGTNGGGLAHLDAKGQWTIFNQDNSDLPHNFIEAQLADNQGGIWIGTNGGGLAHLDADGQWTIFDENQTELPNNQIQTLLSDGKDGLWIGTYMHGLAHFDAEGNWTNLSTYNTGLNKIVPPTFSDGSGGLWAKRHKRGLAHLDADGNWKVFYTYNSDLLDDEIESLQPDGQNGIWVGTKNGGLSHLDINGKGAVFNQANSKLPDNWVTSLHSDNASGVWVGTNDGGLVHLDNDNNKTNFESGLPSSGINYVTFDSTNNLWMGTNAGLGYLDSVGNWNVFNTDNSPLPNNKVISLFFDEKNNLWIGTDGGGLSQLDVEGNWVVFNTDNSPLPDNTVYSLYGKEHLWIGTDSGLARLDADGNWEIFNPDNSILPNSQIFALSFDADDRLLVGTAGGLTRLEDDGSGKVFNVTNSELPSFFITALVVDKQDNIWIGTSGIGNKGGLARVDAKGQWTVFDMDNTTLSSNWINALLPDDSGGIWIGTASIQEKAALSWTKRGLLHLDASGKWTTFNTNNSGLPSNFIYSLDFDDKGGLWVSTDGGLAHLNFGQKQSLIQTIDDENIQTELLNNTRAAIIIHPNGAGSGYNQALAVDFMATYAYHNLHARGYDNDEIYFLSYKPDLDFNADAQADFNVIDAPVSLRELRDGTKQPRDVTVADIQLAFNWAKNKGSLDQPLIVVFIDHGLPGELLLNPLGTETLSAEALKTLLDDYQDATQNKIVVLLEACHTGTLVPTLAGQDRLIISSTDENLAYYSDLGRTSFLKRYFDNLRRGDSFWQAFNEVTDNISTYHAPLNQQRPQLNDFADGSLAQNLCLNGCWGGLPGVLTLIPQMPGGFFNMGQSIDFSVQSNIMGGSVRNVWASVITPEVAGQRNEQGYSLLPTPILHLSPSFGLRRKDDNQWQGNFNQLTTPGEYVVTFKAEDNSGFVTEAQPIILTVQGQHVSFSSNTLHIPAIGVGTETYQAYLTLLSIEPEIILVLDSVKPAIVTENIDLLQFNPDIGKVQIPSIAIGSETFSATLQVISGTSPLQFRVENMARH